mgnify:FL=1
MNIHNSLQTKNPIQKKQIPYYKRSKGQVPLHTKTHKLYNVQKQHLHYHIVIRNKYHFTYKKSTYVAKYKIHGSTCSHTPYNIQNITCGITYKEKTHTLTPIKEINISLHQTKHTDGITYTHIPFLL